MVDLQITKVVIHPAIGIARVGNSPDAYFILPDVTGTPITDPENFRDCKGRIKRQAARFRLFGADADGNIIKELTSDDGEITWTVQVANKKAAWYDFDLALDIPQATGVFNGYPIIASKLRNADIGGSARNSLVIDGGKISICGNNVNQLGTEQAYSFDKGTFSFFSGANNNTSVYLGELRTNENGNLLFLGGRGYSASYSGNAATTFANNDTWHDDTSDGPVDATILFKDGTKLTAKDAWVLTAPPDYSPGVKAFVTGYDLLTQAASDMGKPVLPEIPSFWDQIYPLLERMPLNGWVNAAIFKQYGWGSPSDYSDPEMVDKLCQTSYKQSNSCCEQPENGDTYAELRQAIFRQFRNPDYKTMQAELFPPVYGDGVQAFLKTDTDPRNFLAILPFQYEYLKKWAEGRFTCDGLKNDDVKWDDRTPSDQTFQLDRSALDETIGGPFHPGCEFTWPMRMEIMYSAPFRIKRRDDGPLNYGPTLDSQNALAVNGPLDGSGPGDVTKWMAVPWQTDTASCLSGYNPLMGQYIPTFWPVRVPNDVLTEEDYKKVMNPYNNLAEKNIAFENRKKWLRGIVYDDRNPNGKVLSKDKGKNAFIKEWPNVGILVEKNGPAGDDFPPKIWVESGRTVSDNPITEIAAKQVEDPPLKNIALQSLEIIEESYVLLKNGKEVTNE